MSTRVIIENPEKLIHRIGRILCQAQSIIRNRKECFWNSFQIVNGKSKRVSSATAKKRFHHRFVDRFDVVKQCLISGNFSEIDWIDFRDVLNACQYKIADSWNCKTEVELKALKDSDIIIEVYEKENEVFEDTLKRLRMRL
jgi:hypothetical protein